MRTATKMTKNKQVKKFLRKVEKNAAGNLSGDVDDAWEVADDALGDAIEEWEEHTFEEELERFEEQFDREPTMNERTLIRRFIQVGFGREIAHTFDIYMAHSYIGEPAFRILRRRHH
jgi:hypothetical protein